MTTGPATIPETPSEITEHWLTEALRLTNVISDATVTSIAREALGQGAGFIGQLARLTVTYDDPGVDAPRTMIAKLPATDPGARHVATVYGLYEREYRFYRELADKVRLRTARCYYAAGDVENVRFVLLLEDLGALGTPGDQVAGCTGAEMRTALGQLALHHASWWDDHRLDEVAWLPLGTDLVTAAMAQVYPVAWEKALETMGAHMSPEIRDVVPTLGARTTTMMQSFLDGPMTLAHGDYRLDNIFFGKHGSDFDLAVIDWQSPSRSIGAYDIAYFLYGNVDVETRRAHEMEALRTYHGTLVDHGVSGYSFQQLMIDYRLSLLASLAIFIVNAGTLDTANERGVALFEMFFDRLSAAIMDHDALELLPS
jgi:hypothetical protein